MQKQVYIKTYGCQMNAYDSVRMAELLAPLGYAQTEVREEADLVLLNTCHIREKAAEKVYSELGRIRAEKEAWAARGKRKLIGVAGCVAQAEGEEMLARAPYIDLVVGPQSYQSLPAMIAETIRAERASVLVDFPAEPKFDALGEAHQPQGISAFVSVQEGCDKFCSFCVVPYTRGAEYSRPVAAIEREVRAQLDAGALEITLLGQNVNAFHGEGPDGEVWGLARLIRHLGALPGLKRLRYTTSHPNDMSEDLIRAHAEVETLMPFLHLPVQAGSDAVLKRMNRKHTAAEYVGVIERLRAARPDMGFSSDFIVGFPGETDADFEATLRLIETVDYAQAFSFKYSARPGTPAAEREEQVAEEVKTERLAGLQALLARQQLRFNERMLGRTVPVLFDRIGKKPGQALGKTPWMQSVYVDNAMECSNQLRNVQITGAYAQSLSGVVG